ncbi:hypothetical protein BDZ45DRAFT_383706 [Acephala macrosclerotiorum]|nr:hypothetical protein BDZ45DRAFT_383706 [Acephala macrosclerotiorum]
MIATSFSLSQTSKCPQLKAPNSERHLDLESRSEPQLKLKRFAPGSRPRNLLRVVNFHCNKLHSCLSQLVTSSLHALFHPSSLIRPLVSSHPTFLSPSRSILPSALIPSPDKSSSSSQISPHASIPSFQNKNLTLPWKIWRKPPTCIGHPSFIRPSIRQSPNPLHDPRR